MVRVLRLRMTNHGQQRKRVLKISLISQLRLPGCEKRALGLNSNESWRTYKQAVQGLFTAGTSVIPLCGGTSGTDDVIRLVATRAALAEKRRRKEKVGR